MIIRYFINFQLQTEARQRDQRLRDAYLRRIAEYRVDQLIFVDESGFNTTMGERTHGYAPKGERIVHKSALSRSENISLLPAMTINGYLCLTTYVGAVDKERFFDFIVKDILPRCNPAPQPRSVIVVDNATVHGEGVRY
jgi:hypothetical protein